MPSGVYKHTHKPFLGKHHSQETKKKMGKNRKGRKTGYHTKTEFKKGHISVRKGIKCSEETKKKMSEAKKGKPSCLKGKKRPQFSEEWRRKMSESGKGKHCKEKSHWWQGGLSFEPYTTDWTKTLRRSIRERDRYICQLCGKPQEDRAHSIHHIDYRKENCNSDNLITLCHNCHIRTNSNRNYWISYFQKDGET